MTPRGLVEAAARTYVGAVDDGRRTLFERWEAGDEFDRARMRWLVTVRWIAIAAMTVPLVAALEGLLPGVHHRLILGVTIFGALYNGLLHVAVRTRSGLTGRRYALLQTMIDMGMLTAVLYGTGGLRSPFLGFYVFHVALVAILGGPRAAVAAVGLSSLGALFLIVAEFLPLGAASWDPPAPFGTITVVVAFAGLLVGTGYIAAHATRERWSREQALKRAHDRAALDYQLLSRTLDELDAGLEVLDASGAVLFANRRAEALSSQPDGEPRACPGEGRCENDEPGECPATRALRDRLPGRCRFAHTDGSIDRVVERLTFPLAGRAGEPHRIMNLYVDRTEVTLGERKLMVAERLASLGRIAQGVAHELNTPLATIRTLAVDMPEAIAQLTHDASPEAVRRVAADVTESAALIRDETLRLGRITQALLAGGDLARARVQDGVPLVAVVERARALVVAGLRNGADVTIDPSVAAVRSSVDPDRLMQVLVNLFQNSIDAMRTGGGSRVHVHAEIDGANVRLVVDDEGPGIDPEIRGRLFEPFATTKPPGEGTGLGLYASYMLAKSMGGDLSFEARDGRGARAVVRLPRGVRGLPLASDEPVAQRADV